MKKLLAILLLITLCATGSTEVQASADYPDQICVVDAVNLESAVTEAVEAFKEHKRLELTANYTVTTTNLVYLEGTFEKYDDTIPEPQWVTSDYFSNSPGNSLLEDTKANSFNYRGSPSYLIRGKDRQPIIS